MATQNTNTTTTTTNTTVAVERTLGPDAAAHLARITELLEMVGYPLHVMDVAQPDGRTVPMVSLEDALRMASSEAAACGGAEYAHGSFDGWMAASRHARQSDRQSADDAEVATNS